MKKVLERVADSIVAAIIIAAIIIAVGSISATVVQLIF